MRVSACITRTLGRILVKDKDRVAEKLYRGTAGVCNIGILSHIKITVDNGAIVEGHIVFLGIYSATKYTTNNAHIEGGF